MDIVRRQVLPQMSRSVEHNGVVHISGTGASDLSGGIKEQTRDILGKIETYLANAGTDKSRLLTATFYLKDYKDKEAMTEAWNQWIDPQRQPARMCIGGELAPGMLIEIVVTAAK
jgi:enamine deaminase RidA (YjgF/YER057c/UK114 family)